MRLNIWFIGSGSVTFNFIGGTFSHALKSDRILTLGPNNCFPQLRVTELFWQPLSVFDLAVVAFIEDIPELEVG